MKLNPPDQLLVPPAKTGDRAAFATLPTRHERQLSSVAYRIPENPHATGDVTQPAFLSAVEPLAHHDE